MINAAPWQAQSEPVPNGRRIRLSADETPISFSHYFDLLENDDQFADWYTRLLADADYDAFFWEHPSLTRSRIDADVEFVLIDAAALAHRSADPSAFRSLFGKHREQDIVTFPNLGNDALMIAPCPTGSNDNFAHLAKFLRGGSADQIRSLWRVTARSVLAKLSDNPLWLSTSGLGVIWLHIRLDAYPKYYQHTPYRAK